MLFIPCFALDPDTVGIHSNSYQAKYIHIFAQVKSLEISPTVDHTRNHKVPGIWTILGALIHITADKGF